MKNQVLQTKNRRQFLKTSAMVGSAGAAVGLLNKTCALASPPSAQTDEIFLRITDYGTVGQGGTTDDQPEFQQAIDDLIACGGGTLFVPLPDVRYNWKSPVVIENGVGIHIVGEGIHHASYSSKKFIYFIPNAGNELTSNINTTSIQAPLVMKGCSNCSISNIAIDVNAKSDVGFWLTGFDDSGLGGKRSIQNIIQNVDVGNANRVGLLYGHQSSGDGSQLHTTSVLNSRFALQESSSITNNDSPNTAGIVCMGSRTFGLFRNVYTGGDAGFELYDGGYELYHCSSKATVASVFMHGDINGGLSITAHQTTSPSGFQARPFRSTTAAMDDPATLQIIGGTSSTTGKILLGNNMNTTLIGNTAQGWESDWYDNQGNTHLGAVMDLNNRWKSNSNDNDLEEAYPIFKFGSHFDFPNNVPVYESYSSVSEINALEVSDSLSYDFQYSPILGTTIGTYKLSERYTNHYFSVTSGATRIIELPRAVPGKRFTFTRNGTGGAVLRPHNNFNDVILPGGTQWQMFGAMAQVGASLSLYCSAEGVWTIQSQVGPWDWMLELDDGRLGNHFDLVSELGTTVYIYSMSEHLGNGYTILTDIDSNDAVIDLPKAKVGKTYTFKTKGTRKTYLRPNSPDFIFGGASAQMYYNTQTNQEITLICNTPTRWDIQTQTSNWAFL